MSKPVRGATALEIDLENSWGWFAERRGINLYLVVDGKWHATHHTEGNGSGLRSKGQVPGFIKETFYFPKEYLT